MGVCTSRNPWARQMERIMLSKYLLVSISEGPKSLVPRGLWIIRRAIF
jgi:hypothetical protein